MSEEKKYMFVVTACDGRHEHKACTLEEAIQDAADWHGKSLEHMMSTINTGLMNFMGWEGMDGQMTRIEVVGEYDAFMKAEFGDDDE